MSILEKIFTAIRGGAREIGEGIVDRNSVRIFEQEIREAENKLEQAKRDLTEVMAKEMQTARRIETLSEEIAKHEGYAEQALHKGDEELAMEIAEKIVELQNEQEEQEQARKSFAMHVDRLKAMIKQTNKTLTDMKRQLVMVKTTESVQQATTAISHNYASGNSRLLSAKESLDRIRQRQQELEDRLAAGEVLKAELEGEDLEKRLQEAGIVDDSRGQARDVLARLKARKAD